MFVQGKKNVFELEWNNEGIKYKEVFLQAEKNFPHIILNLQIQKFCSKILRQQESECKALLNKKLSLPAYDQCLKASHIFNLLDARGIIGVAERTGYINRIRELAKGCESLWLSTQI